MTNAGPAASSLDGVGACARSRHSEQLSVLNRANAGPGNAVRSGEGHGQADAIARYGFRLDETARSVGVEFVHQGPTFDKQLDHIMPQVASMGASIAVADFNRDGWPDFYVNQQRRGKPEPSLSESRAMARSPTWLPRLALPTSISPAPACRWAPLWGDYDNDGYEDLFLYKYGRPELFHNDQGNGFTRGWRARGPSTLDQCEQRRVVRLRPRWLARSVRRRLLVRGRGPLEARRPPGSCRRASSTRTTAAGSTCFTIEATARSRKSRNGWASTSRRWTLAAAAADLIGNGLSRICFWPTTTASLSSIANQAGQAVRRSRRRNRCRR